MDWSERQLEIIKAACRRIDEKGIQELTTKNLAADLGLSEAALYRHFRSKNEILLALLDFFYLQLKPRVARALAEKGTAPERLERFMLAPISLFAENPAVVGVIFSDGIFHFDQVLREKIQEIIQFNQQTLVGILAEGQQKGEFRQDVLAAQLAPMVMGSMRFTVLKWKMDGRSYGLLAAAAEACEAVKKLVSP